MTPRWIACMACALLLSSAIVHAGSGTCFAEVTLKDTAEGVPRVALSVRITDGAGTTHTITTSATTHRVQFDELSCGPSTVAVHLPADVDRWTRDKSLRLARHLFEFDEDGRAKVEISILPIRRVQCRVVDGSNKPVGGGTVSASPVDWDGISTLAIGTRIQDDGLGELLLTRGKHQLSYHDDENFLEQPTTVDGVTPESEILEVGDSGKLVVFTVTRPEPKMTVKGVIVDPAGVAIEGIEVETTKGHSQSTESDADGRFRLRIPADSKNIELRASDAETRWVLDPVSLDVERTSDELTWVAKPWTGQRVNVRVLGSDSGEPIVGVHVMADLDCLESSPRRHASFSTNEGGGFAIPCSPGCPPTIDLLPYWSDSPEYFAEQEVAVPPNACGDSWTIRLDRGATFSGTVVDKHGHGIPELHLELVRGSGARASEWTTGSDGAFSFHPLGPGRYEVQLHELVQWGEERFLLLGGVDQPLAPLPPVEIAEQQDVKRDILATEGGALCVRGMQTSRDPGPLPITWLYAVPADTSRSAGGRLFDLRHNRSPNHGCTLGLPAGDWSFTAGSYFSEESLAIPAWTPDGKSPRASVHAVRPGQRTIVETLPGQLVGGVITGLRDYRLTHMDSVSLEVRQVQARDPAASGWVSVPRARHRVAEGRDGEVRLLTMLPPGEYDLRVRIGKGKGSWVSAVPVVVAAGEEGEITLNRVRPGSS